MEESSGSTLTDLSSDSSCETNRRFSSASLFGQPTKGATKSTTAQRESGRDRATVPAYPRTLSPTEPLKLDREQLSRDAVRISLTRRRPLKRSSTFEMGRLELEKHLIEAHNDLDKLIQYTFLVVEENNSLKEILKEAIIISEDGNRDYSEMLVRRDQEIPVLESLNHRSQFIQSHTSTQASTSSSQLPTNEEESPLRSCSENMFSVSCEEQLSTRARGLTDSSKDTSASVHFSIYSASLPQSTVAENSVQAMGNQSNLDVDHTKRGARTPLSIKKLQSLTLSSEPREITESESLFYSDLDSPQSRASVSIKKLKTLTLPKGGKSHRNDQLQSDPEGKSHKRSIQFRKKQKKTTTLPENTHSNEGSSNNLTNWMTVEDDEEEDSYVKKPLFFTSDMLSVIMERNELKEKVHQLEDKISEMEEELAIKQAREEEGSPDPQRKTSFFRRNIKIKNRRIIKESEKFISDVLVIGYKKRERAYVYVIHTTWSDGQRFEIYRRYGEFFAYNSRLQQLFPVEAGKNKSTVRILPSLPTIDNVLSLFGRTNNESVVKQRLGTINEYCQIILRELDTTISRNEFVVSFFRPQPGDRQLQNLARPRTKSELDMSILSVYPQHIPAGSTFEEYITLAEYEPKADGELGVKAGEVVKVISREPTGWWMVSKVTEEGAGKEAIGFVPGDFLKRYDPAQTDDDNSVEVRNKYLGFVSPAAMSDSNMADVDSALKYVAIEDYKSDDPRQLCFNEGAELIVVEKSEDGWWLVVMDGKQGWAPASFMEPMDRRVYPEGENLVVSVRAPEAASIGEKYITKAAFKGEFEEDISFPDKATIEVIEKSISGWWMVRYKGKIGMAPASMLALTETQLNVPQEYKFAMTVDLGHGVSGIIQPPPRSKKFLLMSQSQRRPRSNTNTEEKEFETVLEGQQQPLSSSSGSEDLDVSQERRYSMRKHVRKHVITNEGRKKNLRVKFKAFVRPENLKQKQPPKPNSELDRRGTLPASFFSGRHKKLSFKGMVALVGDSDGSPLVQQRDDQRRATLPAGVRPVRRDMEVLLPLIGDNSDGGSEVGSTKGSMLERNAVATKVEKEDRREMEELMGGSDDPHDSDNDHSQSPEDTHSVEHMECAAVSEECSVQVSTDTSATANQDISSA